MKRTTLIAALVGLACLVPAGLRAHAQAKEQHARKMLSRLAQRLPKASLSAAATGGPSAQRHRSRVGTVALEITASVFVDSDGSGDDLTFGDTFSLFGAILNSSGAELGTWEATVTLTTDSTPLGVTNMTLRFWNQGTVVVCGSPYPDGARLRDSVGDRVPLAPIVGATGKLGYLKNTAAGFAFDDKTGLIIVALGAR
ncbi:MAG: hypothetical protein ACK47B_05455 [Armatimonadota bacterium]